MRALPIALLVLALAAVLAALAWFVLGADPGPRPSPLDPGRTASGPVASADPSQPLADGRVEGSGTRTVPEPVDVTTPVAPRAEAELHVRLVLGPERRPLAGVRLLLERAEGSRPERAALVDGSRAGPGESPATNAEGRATFAAPARYALLLRAGAQRGLSAAGTLEIAPLDPGERRTVELVVAPETHPRIVGRTVDGESGAAVAGARVRVFDELRPTFGGGSPTRRTLAAEVVSGADGRFELELASAGRTAEVEAEGFAPTTLTLAVAGGEPTLVRLRRAAELEVVVTDPAHAGQRGLTVRVRVQPVALVQGGQGPLATAAVETTERSARTDADGRAAIAGLPAETPLVVEVEKDGRLVLREPQPIELAAGSSRRIELVLSGTTRVQGVLREALGAPLANHEVWLCDARGPHATYFSRHDTPHARAVTDQAGRFRFPPVPPGAWAIGPSPRPGWAEQPIEQRLAPVGATHHVSPGQAEVDVAIVAERGLALAGTVLGPARRPVAGCTVRARHAALELELEVESDTAGRFELGPLCSGDWELSALPLVGDDLLASPPVHASAGARAVELLLGRGAEVAGRLLDGEGALVRQGELILSALDGEHGWQTVATADGRFRLRGVSPGRYALCATSSADLAGTLPEIVVGEDDVKDLELVLAPAARLRVEYEGGDSLWFCTVERDGLVVGYAVRNAQTSVELVVPPGKLAILLRTERDGLEETRELELAAGASETVEFR